MSSSDLQKRRVSILIPYYVSEDGIRVFLQKRDKDAKRLPDYFGFFGGGIEEDESPESALKREIKEELGIEITDAKHFSRYEFYGSVLDVFTLPVQSDFGVKITLGEGQFGKFFNEGEILVEKLLIDQDKLILKNFMGQVQYSDPWHFDKKST